MVGANLQFLKSIETMDVPPRVKREFSNHHNEWPMIEPCIVNSINCQIKLYTYTGGKGRFFKDARTITIDIPLSVWVDDMTPTCVWISITYFTGDNSVVREEPLVVLRDTGSFHHPRVDETFGRMIDIHDLWTPAVNFTTLINSLAACLSAPLQPVTDGAGLGPTWIVIHALHHRSIRMHAATVADIMRHLETSIVSTTETWTLAHRGRWLDRSKGDDVPLAAYGLGRYETALIVTFTPILEKIEGEGDD